MQNLVTRRHTAISEHFRAKVYSFLIIARHYVTSRIRDVANRIREILQEWGAVEFCAPFV
jgi:hypothetical protein